MASSAASSSATAAPNWPSNSIARGEDGSITVGWKNAGITDETLQEFVNNRLAVLLQYLPESSGDPIECYVDISGNLLRRPGPIKTLLQKLRSAPVHIVDLRLHKNQLTDVVAAALAEHIHQAACAGRPLTQLHLSGNSFSSAGIRTLIEAAHTSGGYPRKGVNDRWALWLRAEHQNPEILDAEEMLEQCRAAGQPVCMVPKYEKPPKDAVVQMHFGFTMPFVDGKGDFKTKGGKGEPKGKWVPVGKEKGKGKADPVGKADFTGKGKADTAGQKGKEKGFHNSWDDSTDTWGSGAWKGGSIWKGGAPWKGADWAGGSWKGDWKGASDWRSYGWKGDWDDGYSTNGCNKGQQQQQQQHYDEAKGGSKSAGKSFGTKGGSKGHDSSGAGPAYGGKGGKDSAPFKTELCWFHGRGSCTKGEQCTFAHGEQELMASAAKGDSDVAEQQAPRMDKDTENETMSWLKENRNKEGKEGTRFETAWKTWCKEHNLDGQVKSKRIQSMVEFKRRWEGGGLISEMGRAHCEDAADLWKTAPAEPVESAKETQAAMSALAPDPSSLSTAMPTFTKASSSSSKMPKTWQATDEEESKAPSSSSSKIPKSRPAADEEAAPKSESNEEKMVRLLGDKLFNKKNKTSEDAGGVAPHRGPSWESGPPVTGLK